MPDVAGPAGPADELSARLAAAASLNPEAGALVLAACEGEGSLVKLLFRRSEGTTSSAEEHAAVAEPSGDDTAEPTASGVFLQAITVAGFRGIGPEATLKLMPGPGLTLVVGRNGSGKSSFAEALELLLTRNNQRWAKRPAAWREDWRNVHYSGTTSIRAEVTVAGHAGAAVVEATWNDGAKLDACERTAQFKGQKKQDYTDLGWDGALETFRPILSYNELGSILDDGPSKLFDALARVLGVEEVVEIGQRLDRAYKRFGDDEKTLRSAKTGLLGHLSASSDVRAAPIEAVLRRRGGADLDAIEELIGPAAPEQLGEGEIGRLHALAALHAPDMEAITAAAVRLRAAADTAATADATGSGTAREVAGLLETALALHTTAGDGDCPVCATEGVLDHVWRERATERLAGLRRAAADADTAHRELRAAMRVATDPVLPVPDVLDEGPAREAWARWSALRERGDPGRLAAQLEEEGLALEAELEGVRSRATGELRRIEDEWRPLEHEIVGYLGLAREVATGESRAKLLKQASEWVEETANEMRNERFAPVASGAKNIWAMLRHDSNVDLDDIVLTGKKTSRKVLLDVKVDGVPGAALGVMSQGELHALALSLFLPRATMQESPFRFVVIDDPVQSMDPARVDGLARVLEHVSAERQVIVFTHDDRLAEAVRRLQVAARVLQVTRAARSVVEVRSVADPAARAIDDAEALMHTGELSDEVRRRVVPGFCRVAIEARCTDIVRRHRLARGEPYAEVEALLVDAERLGAKIGLALRDDAHMHNDEISRLLTDRFGKRSADAYFDANRGSHQPLPPEIRLEDFVADVKVLVKDLGTVP
jgi:recombinational DNA repair ATPase RecF